MTKDSRKLMKEVGGNDMKAFMWEKMAHGKIPVLNKIEEELNFVRENR